MELYAASYAMQTTTHTYRHTAVKGIKGRQGKKVRWDDVGVTIEEKSMT